MTGKITMKADAPSEGAEQGFASLTDQWIDENWYLPSGGDHSWREREARRMSGGKDSIDDEGPLPVGEPVGGNSRTAKDMGGAPGFKRAPTRKVLLSISLAVCAAFAVAAILAPKILTAGLSDAHEAKAPSSMPLPISAGPRAIPGKVETVGTLALPTPSGIATKQKLRADYRFHETVIRSKQAVTTSGSGRMMPVPHLRPQMPVTVKPDRPSGRLAPRLTNAQPLRAQSLGKPAAKSLPPIGAAYFASHAPAAEPAASSSHPIGQAYFESHSPADVN